MAPMHIDGFAGPVIEPGDHNYEAARQVWNGVIDRRPAALARCTDAGDVAAAIRFAREGGLAVAVRGGAHGVAGTAVCDGGLVIDLSLMKRVSVDPAGHRARAEAGVLWGEFDRKTQAFGLATTGGIVTHTGIAGLTLGGGIGWLMRRHGLTVDNLVSAEMVSAAGERVRASAEENPDLFWALRGAGANFGVVTAFDYRLHPVGPRVLAGPVLWPLEDAVEVLRFYRDFIRDVPSDLTTIVNLRQAPPLPAVPAHLHGRPVCIITCCWAGPAGAGAEVLRPLRSFGAPLADLVGEKPYVAHQGMLDAAVPHGWHYYWKSADLGELKDEVIDAMVAHSGALTSPRSYSLLFQLGGAIAEVPEDATAYSHRSAAHNLNVNAAWLPGDPEAGAHRAWTRDYFAATEAHHAGVYVNFLGDEGQDRVRAAYGPEKYARLAGIKAEWDPDNLFRSNQNIPPAGGRAGVSPAGG